MAQILQTAICSAVPETKVSLWFEFHLTMVMWKYIVSRICRHVRRACVYIFLQDAYLYRSHHASQINQTHSRKGCYFYTIMSLGLCHCIDDTVDIRIKNISSVNAITMWHVKYFIAEYHDVQYTKFNGKNQNPTYENQSRCVLITLRWWMVRRPSH